MGTTNNGHLRFIDQIAQEDVAGLKKAHESYGPSWKKRGGIGAYMVMIRKFDRMEICVEKYGWDIFKAVEDDPRVEGILDDIRDARRYLMLIESVLREQGIVKAGNHRDNVEDDGRKEDVDGSIRGFAMKLSSGLCAICHDRDEPFCSHCDITKQAEILHKAHSLNKELGIECHHPDGACGCFRCLAMKKLSASPHLKGCRCDECRKARKVLDDLADKEYRPRPVWLRTDRQYQKPVTTVLNELDHPAGCKGIRDAELRDHHPHPVACTCRACTIGRADRARARGCEPNCGCNDCLADHYLEQKHE